MDLRTFVAELRRRSVYKIAAAYAVIGWLLIQIATQVFPFLEIPNWAVRLVVLLIVIGFLIALIIAWAFEVTPEGIKRTEPGKPAQSGHRTWIYIVTVGAALSIGLFLVGRFTARPGTPERQTASSDKSIAVLPFESLSEDKTNAYFATGIQDEILARLAKIADLKVISRTSTLQYQSKPGNLSDVAKQLGVANVLEGSVQKVGDQVRVNVQLINAQKDSHVWAETYDRKLTDIFAVESDIAKSVAESLRATLSGEQRQALAIKPTENEEAYDAYLRGLASESESIRSVYPWQKAISFYKRAVHLDPNFALAWSRLSRAYSVLYGSLGDAAGGAKRALERAQALQPNSPETLLALAHYQSGELRDFEEARINFLRVAKMLPGNSEVPAALASIARRQGHWDDAVAFFQQALIVDPRNAELLAQAADNYGDLRQFQTALKLYDRVLDIRPDDLDAKASKAGMYQAEGNLVEAAKYLAEVNPQTPSYSVVDVKLTQLRLERKHDEAVRLLKARFAEFEFGSELEQAIFGEFLSFAQRLAGDSDGAKASATHVCDMVVPLTRDQPDNDFPAIVLSRAYALRGEKEPALKEAERAIKLTPTAKDAALGPGSEENMAVVAVMAGENNRATAILTRLIHLPYQSTFYVTPITPALLRLDPTWDPLRADLAFQKLCGERQQ